MMGNPVHNNELNTEKAFSKQAAVFDEIYSRDEIIRYKRQRVWEHTEQFLCPSSHILELNAGTGEDAIHFARQGHFVHATDISIGMQQKLVQKVKDNKLEKQISHELCSYTELLNLQNEGPYDFIFSNFAGLNCTGRLEKVLHSFSYLLKSGGYVTLVVLPKFCLWEFMLLFRGKFKTAFRRFAGRKGASAQIEGEKFRCWYYNPSFIKKQLKDSFTVVAQEGLCTIVPPSYMEGFATKHPKLYKYLKQKENKLKSRWPWRVCGDYYILTLRKN